MDWAYDDYEKDEKSLEGSDLNSNQFLSQRLLSGKTTSVDEIVDIEEEPKEKHVTESMIRKSNYY